MSSRWRVLLIVSLAVNLFLGGVLAARAFGDAGGRGERSDARRWSRQADLEALSPERRAAFVQQMRRTVQDNRPLTRQMREARRAAGARFADEPYDAAAVAAALRRAEALEMELRRRVQAAILAQGALMTPAERAALAPLIERGGDRRGMRRGRGGRRDS